MSRCAHRCRGRVLAAALVAVVLMAAAGSAADHEEPFRDGMSALDQKKWAVAAASFRAAIVANPREGGKPIRVYGTWLIDYLPHYYLGVALFQSGDPAGAAEAWRESRSQGVVLTTALAPDLERWEQRLPRPAPRAPEPIAPEPPARPEPLPLAAAPVAAAAAPPVPAPPSPEAQRAAARRALLPAARDYSEGRYREAQAALRRLAWPDGPPAEACLLESASAFALYRQSGGADARLLRDAERPLRSCAALAGGGRPDPALFSPAFTRFFEETVASR
jgi:hypothetical protein